MGKKYVIEIIEKPFKDDAGREVWRAKGFNTLYFDQNGLDKLKEYKEFVDPEAERKIKLGDLYLYDNSEYMMVTKAELNKKRIYCILEDGTPQVYGLGYFKEHSVFVHDRLSFDDFLNLKRIITGKGGLKCH